MDTNRLTEVIQAAQAGDPGAFDALVDAYARRVYGFVFRLTGSRNDAEDLLQEVMLRVVRRLGEYRHDGRFEAWLFRIAVNLVRDRARRLKTRGDVGSGGDHEDGSSFARLPDRRTPAPDHHLRLTEQIDELQDALARLPVAEREVIMLRHFSDMSFKDISGLMEAPLGTTLARAHRGLRKLRELMDPDGWKQTGTS